MQDVLGVTAAIPEAACERLELMLTGQMSSGGAMPIVKPFDHHPGHEKGPDDEEYRSDDCLWFFNAVPAYVDLELGILETRTFERFRSRADNSAAARDFLQQQAGRVHVFRQRVPVRGVDTTVYR